MKARLTSLVLLTAMTVRADTLIVSTDDGGKTWTDIDPGTPHFSLWDMIAACDGSAIYAVTSVWGSSDGVGFTYGEAHLLVTRDAGRSWRVLRSLNRPESIKLAVDPADPRTVYLAVQTVRGITISKSTDAGESFTEESVDKDGNLRGFYMTRFTIDPSSRSTLYITLGEEDFYLGGLLRSTDGGKSWSSFLHGAIWDLAVDASKPSTVYMVGSCLGESSCFNPFASRSIFRSTDGGQTLERRFPPCAPVINVATDSSRTGVVFASCDDGSVWKSMDEARTWRLLRNPEPVSWLRILSANGSRLYARKRGPDSSSLQHSDDGGQTWTTLLENMGADFFLIAPDSPQRLFAGSGGRQQPVVTNRSTYARNYADRAQLAPGMLASIYGENLTAGVQFVQDSPWPSTLAGAKVEVNGQEAPLFYASPTQIDFQVPFGIEGAATLEVKRADGSSERQTISLLPTVPIVLNRQDRVFPLILHEDGISLVAEDSPALPGEHVTLHLVGLGDLEPPLAAGTLPAPGRRHWLKKINEIFLYDWLPFRPIRLQPEFFGASPKEIGIYVLEVRLPDSLPAGTYFIRHNFPGRFDVALPVGAAR